MKLTVHDMDALVKVMAENLPSPYAQSDVWEPSAGGPVFNLEKASEHSVEEWGRLARAVLEFLNR